MIINIKTNLRAVIKVCNFGTDTFFIKSAETCAFKNALGIARNATNAIPNSTISIVPLQENLRNVCQIHRKVNAVRENKIVPDAIAA